MSDFNLLFRKFIHVISLPECEICHGALSFGEKFVCKKCAKQLRGHITLRTLDNGVEVISTVPYRGYARQVIHSYKFDGKENISKALAKYIYEAIKDKLPEIDIITWIPGKSLLSLIRGFNQTKLVAKNICKLSGSKTIKVTALLKKTKSVMHQYEIKDFSQRYENIKDAYVAIHTNDIAGKNILIIDDIVTSGATLSECSDRLLKCGAKSVLGATFAYADFNKRQLDEP